MSQAKLWSAFIIITLLALFGLLLWWLHVTPTIEQFFDNQTICMKCIDYFRDALSIPVEDIPMVGGDAVITNQISDRISQYTVQRNGFVGKVLDALLSFVEDRKKGLVCKNILEPGRDYFTCMNKYVMDKMDCKQVVDSTLNINNAAAESAVNCSTVLPIVDMIVTKARICSTVACDDITKYPRADEQAQCRNTNQCKTIDDLEQRIIIVIQDVKKEVLECLRQLTDRSSQCSMMYSKTLYEKMKGRINIQLAQEDGVLGPSLASQYGSSQEIFDRNTMYVKASLVSG